MSVKKDCIMYDVKFGHSNKGMCRGLKKLYCDTEECGFYKPESQYNADGKRKAKNNRFVTPVSQ